ncbi:WD40 repeat-like protein [Zopfia rhizophila CBS 207.26]|uniref:WD40 repeat-like protein n=1 Tax=Zopfia rhizophila CBS 207.26 TaxID=1314779 RepID=A0A6A6DHN3_9PEZI|nr:WD40 repeat-like protein [Zopfia rhizophila CBS 207.26]
MGKRKRDAVDGAGISRSRKEQTPASTPKQKPREKVPASQSKHSSQHVEAQKVVDGTEHAAVAAAFAQEPAVATMQIITGSYERVLHGFTAAVPQSLITGQDMSHAAQVSFTDTFLFNAHASAIRCLALSPSSAGSPKITLATGSTDERINLYSLSTVPPPAKPNLPKLPALRGTSIAESSKNKELGSLLHHSSSITALHFPTRSKLLSSAEDSMIAVTRTRDWIPLSTIQAPIPKPQGRPSGDTAAPGEVPAGINSFAVHPSMKLMVSVGKGERCMRLWNLVTGKKAGVLNFGKEVLGSVGEGRYGAGEGRRVVWDGKGDNFVVGFERGAVLFGIDSRPRAKIVPSPRTKLHQMHYLPGERYPNILLISTEDGRILLYDANPTTTPRNSNGKQGEISSCELIAQLGGPAAGITGRVKDFEILAMAPHGAGHPSSFAIITGSSDGSVRVWTLNGSELEASKEETDGKRAHSGYTAKQVGKLIGTYSTGTRITCLTAFMMTGTPAEADEEEIVDEKSSSSDSDGGESM